MSLLINNFLSIENQQCPGRMHTVVDKWSGRLANWSLARPDSRQSFDKHRCYYNRYLRHSLKQHWQYSSRYLPAAQLSYNQRYNSTDSNRYPELGNSQNCRTIDNIDCWNNWPDCPCQTEGIVYEVRDC